MYYGTYQRLNLHCSASARDVIRAAQRKLKKRARYSREQRNARHQFYRAILAHHTDWQKTVAYLR